MESVEKRFINFKINILKLSIVLTFFLALFFFLFHFFMYKGKYHYLVLLMEITLVIISFFSFIKVTEKNYKIIATEEFLALFFTIVLLSVIYYDNYFFPIWMFGTLIVFSLVTDFVLGVIFLFLCMGIFDFLYIKRVDLYAFLTLNAQFIAYFLFGLILIKKIQTLQEKTYIYENLLYEVSIKDVLTNLYNRNYFEKTVKLLLEKAKRNNQKVLFLILDIDHFKNINDTYGHPTGDIVLIEITKLIKNSLRKSDLFARIGGEEFAIFIDDCKDNPHILAEKLRKIVEDLTIKVENLEINVTISIGGVLSNNYDYEYLYKKADENLYIAKKSRNKVVISKD